MYGLRLARDGWEVIRAAAGAEVLRLASQRRPDLILLDLRLAGMDGRRVLKGLAADRQSSRIPVVVFSNASRDSDEAREALRLGASAFLVKADTDPEALGGLLEGYLG